MTVDQAKQEFYNYLSSQEHHHKSTNLTYVEKAFCAYTGQDNYLRLAWDNFGIDELAMEASNQLQNRKINIKKELPIILSSIEKLSNFLHKKYSDYYSVPLLSMKENSIECHLVQKHDLNSLTVKGTSLHDKTSLYTINKENDKGINTGSRKKEDIINLLEESNVRYVDKRKYGGSLWIIGGTELSDIVNKAKSLGYNFRFLKKGGRATKKRPGWWTK